MGICTSKQSNIVHATITVQPYLETAPKRHERTVAFPRSPERSPEITRATQRSKNFYQLRKVVVSHNSKSFKRALTVAKIGETSFNTSIEESYTKGQSSLPKSLGLTEVPEPQEKKSIAHSKKDSQTTEVPEKPQEKKSIWHSKKDSQTSQSTVSTVLSDDSGTCSLDDVLSAPADSVSNHEKSCKEMANTLVSNDKETRDKVHAILSEWDQTNTMIAIKNHARSASADVASNLLTLAEYLARSSAKYLQNLVDVDFQHANTLAKALTFYYWICTNISYDTNLWKKCMSEQNTVIESLSEVEAEEVLSSRASICVGYAHLFAEMCKAVGMEAEVIKGEVCFVPIPALSADTPRSSTAVPHTWNAINLGGTWFPVDCTFGTSYRDKAMDFRPNYTRHFFATTPSTFILTHWPADERWQLLQNPVSQEELEPLVIFPSCAFGRGLQPLTWNRAIQLSKTQQSTSIELLAKKHHKIGAKLVYLDEDIGKVQEIQTSNNLIYIQRDGESICIRAALPFSGSYSLLISINQEKKRASQLPQVFLSYHITCLNDSNKEIGYPKVYEMAASAFEFRLLYWNQSLSDCICESDAESLSLAFKAKRGMSCSHFLIPGKTRNTRPTDHTSVYNYNTMIVADSNVSSDSDQSLQMLKVVFPEEGWWTICLNGTKGNPNAQTHGGFVTLMSYHVFAWKGDPDHTFPYILSPHVSFCHFDPIQSISESFEIPFTTTKPMEFHTYLVEKKPNARELDSYVDVETAELVSPSPNQYRLKASFPKPGKWYVRVFACEKEGSKNDEHTGLFSLLVDVVKPMQNATAVKLNAKFTESIQLSVLDKGYISFLDNGHPLQVEFECGETKTEFHCQIRPEDSDYQHLLKDYQGLSLLDHCTYLSPVHPQKIVAPLPPSAKVRPRLKSLRSHTHPVFPTHLCEPSPMYRLNASFPWSGKWTVELYAKAPDAKAFTLAFHVAVDISKPSKGICYPILHQGFQELCISIPEQSASYNPICGSSEFDFPFNAHDDVQFAWNIEVAGSSDSFLQQGFVHQFGKRNPSHHFQLSFCTPGLWKAQLFAAKPKDSKPISEDKYMPVLELSFLVDTTDKDVSFPELFPAFKNYGLSIAKTHLPLISRIPNSNTAVVIPFFSPDNVKFWHRVMANEASEEECTAMTQMLSNTSSGLHEVLFQVPKPGVFRIMLWAQPMESREGVEWEPVLRHTVECMN